MVSVLLPPWLPDQFSDYEKFRNVEWPRPRGRGRGHTAFSGLTARAWSETYAIVMVKSLPHVYPLVLSSR